MKYILVRTAMVGIRNTAAVCLSPLRLKSCFLLQNECCLAMSTKRPGSTAGCRTFKYSGILYLSKVAYRAKAATSSADKAML